MTPHSTFEEPPTYSEQVTVRLTDDQIAALDAYADRHELTRAQAVRQAIGTALIVEHTKATRPTTT